MNRDDEILLLNRLNVLMENNNRVIQAIRDNKEINYKKAIAACMKSNNEVAQIVKDLIVKSDSGKSNQGYKEMMDEFLASLGKK